MKEVTQLTSATLDLPASRRPVAVSVERGSTVLMERAEHLYDQSVKPTYGTDGLSTQKELRRLIAGLEGAGDCFLLPTGLAAITLPLFACLRPGDEILVTNSAYRPVRHFLDRQLQPFGITPRYYDPALDAESVLDLATPATRMIYAESPGSLTFDIQDLPGLAREARRRGILSLCDNTYGAGVLFKPLAHGFDISVQALTKYVGGHSDILMGSLCVNDNDLGRKIDQAVKTWGFFTSADESYLALRGLRTLHLRLKRSAASGLTVASWLEQQPEVERVVHPGLASHPGHDLFQRDFLSANGLFMVIFKKRGDADQVTMSHAFLNALTLFGIGHSWGGYESLAVNCEPQIAERRLSGSCPDWAAFGAVIRLYVGLEDPADLIADLERALQVFA